VQEVFLLSFKLIIGDRKLDFSPAVEMAIAEILVEERSAFVNDRAVPSIRRTLRNKIMADVKAMVERETRNDIQQVLFSLGDEE